MKRYLLCFVTVWLIAVSAHAPGNGPAAGPPAGARKIWIYFTDHGEKSRAELSRVVAAAPLSERSLQRRRDRGARALTDVHDLPVNKTYLTALRTAGCHIRRTSKYLNAASVRMYNEGNYVPRISEHTPSGVFRDHLKHVMDSDPVPWSRFNDTVKKEVEKRARLLRARTNADFS